MLDPDAGIDPVEDVLEPVEKSAHAKKPPRCAAVAEAGIRTGNDLARFLASSISDFVCGRLPAAEGNAAINAVGKLLHLKEIQFRSGIPSNLADRRDIELIDGALELEVKDDPS